MPGNPVCTNIEVEGRLPVIYSATFFSPVAGKVYFQQVDDSVVTISGKLYWVTTSGPTSNHTWHIHINPVSWLLVSYNNQLCLILDASFNYHTFFASYVLYYHNAAKTTTLITSFLVQLLTLSVKNIHVQPNEGYQVGTSCDNNTLLGHYDPFNARPESITTLEYAMFCNISNPDGCELGDLAGRFGQINIDGKIAIL